MTGNATRRALLQPGLGKGQSLRMPPANLESIEGPGRLEPGISGPETGVDRQDNDAEVESSGWDGGDRQGEAGLQLRWCIGYGGAAPHALWWSMVSFSRVK